MTLSFTISRTELLKASRAMSKIIKRRNKIPILGCCLIGISADQVQFSGTDPAIIDSDDPNAFWVLMPIRV